MEHSSGTAGGAAGFGGASSLRLRFGGGWLPEELGRLR